MFPHIDSEVALLLTMWTAEIILRTSGNGNQTFSYWPTVITWITKTLSALFSFATSTTTSN